MNECKFKAMLGKQIIKEDSAEVEQDFLILMYINSKINVQGTKMFKHEKKSTIVENIFN